jgi:hypothetical protein
MKFGEALWRCAFKDICPNTLKPLRNDHENSTNREELVAPHTGGLRLDHNTNPGGQLRKQEQPGCAGAG